ncbi:MAG: hypothetical protein NTX15_03840, partial [Candidatus Kapabacteria bacterium]|nr:hypothetical protein [Candidatus Kapabacteria bacterium]
MNSRLSKSLALMLFIVASTSFALAGSVTILPMSPKEGATVTIEYIPDAVDASVVGTGKLYALIYSFSFEAEAPRASDILLEKDGKKWIGTFTPAKGTVYSIVKVGNG